MLSRRRPTGSSSPVASFVVLAALVVARPVPGSEPAPGRDLRIHDLDSEVLARSVRVRVLLPAGYELSRRLFPVLYLNDGQNLFDTETSVFNPLEWEVDETVARLIRQEEIEPLVVVGIDSPGRRGRATEYLPFEDTYLHPPEPNPRGDLYPEFLVTELLPFIQSRYRVRTGASATGIGGSSYGAVAALSAAIERPDVFGRVLLESPSLYVGDGRILAAAESAPAWPDAMYIGVGTNEEAAEPCPKDGVRSEAVQDVRKLQTIGEARGDVRLHVVVEECAGHGEAAWAERLPIALRFLFGPSGE